MAQLSRPYQIALAAVAVLALVWFVALRSHGSNPSGPAPSSPAPTPVQSSSTSSGLAAAEAHKAAAPTPIYHGPAPGVEGLTRDIAKAHHAVAISQAEAAHVEHSSADASEVGASAGSAAASSASSHSSSAHTRTGTAHATATHGSSSKASSGNSKSGKSKRGDRARVQLEVEGEIASGKTVLLVFWQPQSAVDETVRQQALALQAGSKGRVAVHVALAKQVGLFGPLTEVTHVYQTPTVLIVGRHGLVSELTGLQDEFSLRQAVREAEQANR